MKSTEIRLDQFEALEPLRRLVKSMVMQELDYRDNLSSTRYGSSRNPKRKKELVNHQSRDLPVGELDLIGRLSSRETEVLVLLANGYSRNEISESLGVRYNTACSHISNIYSKLSITNVAEATQIAMRSGVLQQRC